MFNYNVRKTIIFFCVVASGIIFFCGATSLYGSSLRDVFIEGLELEKIESGSLVYLIKADKATFGNKRIKFFNIALIKVINLTNVILTIYENGSIIETRELEKAVYELSTKRLLDEEGNVVFCGE